MLKTKKIALIGCGDIGNRLAPLLQEMGADVTGFRRTPEKITADIKTCSVDVQNPESLKILTQQAFDYLVVSLTADALDDDGYQRTYVQGLQHILDAVNSEALKRLFWVSSTSVYHQSDDSWVDEHSPTLPERFSGRRQLEAENLLEQLPGQATIVRFAGIYRDQRYRLIERILAGQLSSNIPHDYYTNRIHVQDCAGILAHLIQLDAAGGKLERIYLGVDSSPVRYSELLAWLTLELGVPLAEHAPPAASRSGSKRCSNRRLLASGYTFQYPDYKSGLKPMIEKTRKR